MEIRKAIKTLKKIFEVIRQKQGKDVSIIFAELIDENQEISCKGLVDKLIEFDPNQSRSKLIGVVRALDQDGSGAISLDEFL